MYRGHAVSSLRSKLSRLSSAGPGSRPAAEAPPEPTADKSVVLDDLRRRMDAMLARSVSPRTPPPVETVELPFTTTDTPLGPLHTRRLALPVSHVMGRFAVQPARDADSALLALLALDPSLASLDLARALYLDTETTGLAGGTGTVAFLVGLGGFEADGSFVVEQLLVRNLGEEGPMLARVAERIAEASMLVTFNGKSFDMPLLRTRFVLARQSIGVEPPHLDLVHVARRIHRARGGAFRLVRLERDVLGFEREDDVPSGDVAAHYLHFLRSGDARALLGVVEHNAWDVATMAVLVGLYGEPLEASQLEADDLAGVAISMKRAGAVERAFDVAHQAVERATRHRHQAGIEASLEARAKIAKARGDRARALADYENLAAKVDSAAVRLELAKLYEHFAKAPGRALHVTRQGTGEDETRAEKRRRRLAAKLDRMERADKLAATAAAILAETTLRLID
jgi:uncharacterized protein YprB with RNaseH-like and TPR domain